MDKGFAAMAYSKVQENLKLTVEEQVLLEELASSSGTLSSLQHLTKDLSFGDLFFSDKPSQADNDKATAETEAESMVSVTIQQDMSSIPPMKTPIIDLTLRLESPKVHQLLKATATETTTTTTTTIILPPPSQQQQSTTDAMMMKRIGELEHIMANLIQENKRLEQRLDNHGAHMYILEQLDIPHQVSKAINEVVTDAIDWAMQTPLHHMQLYKALVKSMNRDHSEELAKDLAEARKKKKKSRESPKTPPGSPPHQTPPPPPPAGPSGALGSPRASGSSQVSPPPPPPPSTNQEEQSSDDEDIGSTHIPKVNLRQDWWKPFEEERHATPEPAWLIPSSDVPVPPNNWASALASNYSPPLEDSLLSQAGDIAMFMDWFFRTHMRILSVVKIEVFSMYGYDYMKKIVLRHADLNKHVITKRYCKFLYPSDFEDMYLLNLQEDFWLGIESYQTQLNLTKPRWDTTGFEYKHDYTVIDSPRAIEEALDYRVKEFKINKMNLGLNTRFWTKKDVDRSKARISEPVGSSLHDDSPYAVLGQSNNEEESEKVVLGATTGGNDEDQARPDPGAQDEGQTGTDAGTLDKGQAGSNPDEMSEGQAGPDPSNAKDEEQSILSHAVHAGSDREHMDLDVANVLPQPFTEQLDEGFTATVYPKVQENLKLAVEEQVLLEEPASSSGILSSLQHMGKDICFGDQFFSDKPSDADKNAEAKVESMVNVPIQQAVS
nr:hypothetical protein [Tanacetum cinerariifolium]